MNDVKTRPGRPTPWGRVLVAVILCLGIGSGGPEALAGEKDDPALDLYFSANSLCSRRFYKLATNEYKEFLKKYPNHAKAPKAQ